MPTLRFILSPCSLLVAYLLLLVGCQSVLSDERAQVTPTSGVVTTNRETDMSAPTVIPPVTLTPTRLAIASATALAATLTDTARPATSTATPLPPTVTATITPAATLTIEEESDYLSELMTHNGSCELPCWWGIVPGQTQVQAARDKFAQAGVDRWSEAFDGQYAQLFLGHEREEIPYYLADVGFRLYPGHGTVEIIHVLAGGIQGIPSDFLQEWQPFALSTVLTNYGVPSYIQFEEIPRTEPGTPQYLVVVSYPETGMEFQYRVPAERLADTSDRVCLDLKSVLSLEIVLFVPSRIEDVPFTLVPKLTEYKSWKEITDTENVVFYDIFAREGPACIDVTRP